MWWWAPACSFRDLSAEQRAEIERDLAAYAAARDAALPVREAAVAGLDALQGGADRCPIEVPVPSMEAGSTSSMDEAVARLRGAQFLSERLDTGLGLGLPPPRLRTLDGRAAGLRRDLEDPFGPDGDPLLGRAAELLPLGWDAVLTPWVLTMPYTSGADTFQPGAVVGRLAVYSYDEGRFVCVADAAASSSGTVRVVHTEIGGSPIASTGTTDAVALHQDLQVNLLAAAVPALRRIQAAP